MHLNLYARGKRWQNNTQTGTYLASTSCWPGLCVVVVVVSGEHKTRVAHQEVRGLSDASGIPGLRQWTFTLSALSISRRHTCGSLDCSLQTLTEGWMCSPRPALIAEEGTNISYNRTCGHVKRLSCSTSNLSNYLKLLVELKYFSFHNKKKTFILVWVNV